MHTIELSFIFTSSVEYSSFEYYVAQCKHLTVLAVYRPPSSSIPVVLDQFEELIARLDSAAGRVIITGFQPACGCWCCSNANNLSIFTSMLTALHIGVAIPWTLLSLGHLIQ